MIGEGGKREIDQGRLFFYFCLFYRGFGVEAVLCWCLCWCTCAQQKGSLKLPAYNRFSGRGSQPPCFISLFHGSHYPLLCHLRSKCPETLVAGRETVSVTRLQAATACKTEGVLIVWQTSWLCLDLLHTLVVSTGCQLPLQLFCGWGRGGWVIVICLDVYAVLSPNYFFSLVLRVLDRGISLQNYVCSKQHSLTVYIDRGRESDWRYRLLIHEEVTASAQHRPPVNI